jgi:hypothetical protein
VVELFFVHELANIGQNKLELVVEHWQTKNLATIQNKNQSFGYDEKLLGKT